MAEPGDLMVMNVSICPIYGYGTLVKYMSGWNAKGMAPLSSSPAGASGAACGMENVDD